MNGPPVEVQPDSLPEAFQQRRQSNCTASNANIGTWHLMQCPWTPVKLSASSGVKLCTYQRWFARPAGSQCPNYCDVPMGTAKLQRTFRLRMDSHMLPLELGRHLQLPRHRRVCKWCRTGTSGDERHLLLECPALADVRTQFPQLIARFWCRAIDTQMLFHAFSFVGCQG